MRSPFGIAPLALAGALALTGCGPLRSTSLLLDADVQLEAARTADAAKFAPYEFTLAGAYLEKAREEQGYADYDVCIDFAEKALSHAKTAKEKAIAQAKAGAEPYVPPEAKAAEKKPAAKSAP